VKLYFFPFLGTEDSEEMFFDRPFP